MSIVSIHLVRWSAASLRRGSRPTSAASVPTLTAEERVLCRAVRDGSLTAVGTDAALHYRRPGGAWRRISWVDLTSADRSMHAGIVELHSDRALAALAAERIAHLRILRRHVELRPGVSGIVEAVRVSDRAAPLWRVHLDEPAHRHDPLVQQACRAVISELRSLTGC